MSSPALNLEETSRFLAALDPGTDDHRFQTIDDKKPAKDELAVHRFATLDAALPWLTRSNADGAGVFVTINATDGGGRKAKNVTRLRALFIDGDGIPFPSSFPIPPSIVVRRDDTHWHVYWLLAPETGLAYFKAAQGHLATHYGSDPTTNDLPRVMRLPGLYHNKGQPILVRLVEAHPERRYSLAEVLAAHGGVPQAETPRVPRPRLVDQADEVALAMFRYHAEHTEAPAQGGRHDTARNLLCEAYSRAIEFDDAVAIVEEFCARVGIETGYAERTAKWAYSGDKRWTAAHPLRELWHGADFLVARVAEMDAKAGVVLADVALKPGGVLYLLERADSAVARGIVNELGQTLGAEWRRRARESLFGGNAVGPLMAAVLASQAQEPGHE